MRTLGFFLAVLPGTLLFQGLLCWLLTYTPMNSTFSPMPSDYFEAIVLGVLVRLVLLTTEYLGKNGTPMKFYIVPCVAQFFRLLCLFYVSKNGQLIWQTFVTYVSAYMATDSCMSLINNSPIGYSERFNDFLALYSKFIKHEALDEVHESCKNDYKSVFDILSSSSKIEKKNSLDSGGSNDSNPTLVAKTSAKDIPTYFNGSLSKAKSFPIIPNCTDSDPYSFIDTVSPKTTFSIDTKLLSTNVDNNIGPELPSPFDGSSEKSGEIYQHKLSCEEHLGGGGGGNFRFKLPDGSKLEFGGGAGFDYGDSDSDRGRSEASISKMWSSKKDSNYTLTSRDCSIGYNMIESQETSKLLQKKFSTYTLNSIKEDSAPLIVDLEAQTQMDSRTLGIDRCSEFNYFIRSYLDERQNAEFNIDPLFEEFGLLTLEAPWYFVIFANMNAILFIWLCFLSFIAYFFTSCVIFCLLFGLPLLVKAIEMRYINNSVKPPHIKLMLKFFFNTLISSMLFASLLHFNSTT